LKDFGKKSVKEKIRAVQFHLTVADKTTWTYSAYDN